MNGLEGSGVSQCVDALRSVNFLRSLALFIALAVALPLAAQPLTPAPEPPGSGSVEGRFSTGLSAAKLAEDWYLLASPSFVLTVPDLTLARGGELFERDQTHDLRLRFSVPLRFRVQDNEPVDGGGAFRREDWDEAAEYLRVIRGVEYGTPYDGVFFRGGELTDVRIRHRTIVDGYENVLDLDHFQWGLQSSVNTHYGGGELLLDNVADPELMGLRLYARPAAFADRTSPWSRFALGWSLVGDRAAPRALRASATGSYEVNADGNFIEDASGTTGIMGFDAEYTVPAGERVRLTPYMDANVHLGSGSGWHVGAFLGWQIAPDVVMDLRAEYRLLGEGYLPSYFGPLYEVERLSFLPVEGSPVRAPKRTWLDLTYLGRRSGYLGELGFNIRNRLYLSGTWEDARGPNNNAAWIAVRVPAWSIVQFGARWVNTRFNGARGLFDPENALATAEARVLITPWLYVEGQANRRWALTEQGSARGDYTPVDDFALGAGVTFGF